MLGFVALSGCIGLSSRGSPEYTNPDRCDALVAEHRADPRDLGEAGPQPLRISLPPVPDATVAADVELVVDEFGDVADGSIVVSGTVSPAQRRGLEESVEAWDFEPAQVDGCWVPARFRYEVLIDRTLSGEIALPFR